MVESYKIKMYKLFAYVSLFLNILGLLLEFVLFINPFYLSAAGILLGLLASIYSSHRKVAIASISLGIFNILWSEDLFYLIFSGYV